MTEAYARDAQFKLAKTHWDMKTVGVFVSWEANGWMGIKGKDGPGLWGYETLKTRLKALDGAAAAVPEGDDEIAKVAQVGSKSDTC